MFRFFQKDTTHYEEVTLREVRNSKIYKGLFISFNMKIYVVFDGDGDFVGAWKTKKKLYKDLVETPLTKKDIDEVYKIETHNLH